ncbi:unnamed protein product [Pleuronectes platessa]|uniref:Uncharacterized protein n=1 Tax=Pleuronectes platessa TaxID=8262 RepID=A0A9N7Y3T8_PLEPL|nr:unnamed protein product [Pleuronectes platessa]
MAVMWEENRLLFALQYRELDLDLNQPPTAEIQTATGRKEKASSLIQLHPPAAIWSDGGGGGGGSGDPDFGSHCVADCDLGGETERLSSCESQEMYNPAQSGAVLQLQPSRAAAFPQCTDRSAQCDALSGPRSCRAEESNW